MPKQDVCREKVPNDWELQGELYLEEQCEWYQAMFEACKNRSWLRGFALWEWAPKLPSESEAWKDDSYEICNKPVQEVDQEILMKMRQKNTSQRVQKNSLSQKSEQDLWREEAEMMHLFRQNRESNGNVLESGSYEELMEQKGVFYQMEHL